MNSHRQIRTERPVFHDQTGRRRRWMTVVFVSLGVAMMATLGTLALAVTGTTPIPLPGFPEATRNADRDPASTPKPPGPPANNSRTPTADQSTADTTTTEPAASTPATIKTNRGQNPTQPPGHSKPPKNN